MYIHCAFPASLLGAARTHTGNKSAPRAKLVSHEKKEKKGYDASSSPGALYYSNTMYCDKSLSLFFLPFFFTIAKQARQQKERERERETKQNEIR